ncbi:conserved hypothetical protein [gamma proteobacterium HTCC5015]|nr:conserved hypothetical protein [gamma proteobacterium HTCC5015]
MEKTLFNKSRRWRWLALSACLAASLPMAALEPLGESELSEVNGQGVITIDKFTDADYPGASADMEFIKITQGLTIDINANIRRIRLGEYGGNVNRTGADGEEHCIANKCTADIDMEYMSLGTVDPANGTFTTMTIIDPYIEFAVDTSGSEREVAGFRLGARYQDGILSGRNNVLSGNVQVRAFPQGGIANLLALLGADELEVGNEGKRFTYLSGAALGLIDLEAPLISSPKLNVDGIRNFWISVQDQEVDYPDYGGLGGLTHSTAQPGFWLNLADNVTIRDMQPSECQGGAFLIGCTDFGNAFPNNCWNGNQTQTLATDAAHPFTAIRPNCH